MSHRHISVPCKYCGSHMGNSERIKRRLWQGVMFPYSGRFECIACGKKQSFINLNRYISQSDLRKSKGQYAVKNTNGMRKVSAPAPPKQDDSSGLEDYKSLRSIVVRQQHKIHSLKAELSRLKKHH